MTNQPNEAAETIVRFRPILSSVRDDSGVFRNEASTISSDVGEYVLHEDHVAIVTSLRSALANAEKSLATVTGDCARYHGMFDGTTQLLLMARQERDQALAKGAEAEKRADSLQLETNCARNERDSAIDDWGALKSEREALAAQLAEARWIPCSERMPEPDEGSDPEYGVTARVLIWHPRMQHGPCTAFYWFAHKKWCDDESMGPLPDHCQATHWRPLPAPPSDRGAEGEK